MAVRPRHRASACIGALALASLVPLEACIGNDTPREANTETPAEAAAVGTETAESSGLIFINLLPWGEVDFTRGEFPSLGDCNAVVRALPTYSFYTTPERCEPIDDPVYCTVWRDGDDDRDSIACHKGPGGMRDRAHAPRPARRDRHADRIGPLRALSARRRLGALPRLADSLRRGRSAVGHRRSRPSSSINRSPRAWRQSALTPGPLARTVRLPPRGVRACG